MKKAFRIIIVIFIILNITINKYFSRDIKMDLDFANKPTVLKGKDSKLTLIKCDLNYAKKYYKNYKD